MTFIRPEEVLEIMFRIPNLEPFLYITEPYEEVVLMYDYKEFPISEDEFNSVKEYLTERYGDKVEAWQQEPNEEEEEEVTLEIPDTLIKDEPEEPLDKVFQNKNSNAYVRKLNYMTEVPKAYAPYILEAQKVAEQKMLQEAYRILNENTNGTGLMVSFSINHAIKPSIRSYMEDKEVIVSTLNMSPGYIEMLEPATYK